MSDKKEITAPLTNDSLLPYFNSVSKLILLHLIKTAITKIDEGDKSLMPPNVLVDVDKQRATIDDDIAKQQSIVNALSSNKGGIDATAHTKSMPQAWLQ